MTPKSLDEYGTDTDSELEGGVMLSRLQQHSTKSKKGRKPRYMDFDCAECDSSPICAKGLCSRCYQRGRKQQLNATNARRRAEKAQTAEPQPLRNVFPYQGTQFNAGEALATLGSYSGLDDNRRKIYPCPHCNKPFYKPSQTARHVRTHTGEKPFACPHMHCNRSFAEKGNLRRHLKMHTGEKPFTCTACNRRFSRRSHLSEHLKVRLAAKNFDTHHAALAAQPDWQTKVLQQNVGLDEDSSATEEESEFSRKNPKQWDANSENLGMSSCRSLEMSNFDKSQEEQRRFRMQIPDCPQLLQADQLQLLQLLPPFLPNGSIPSSFSSQFPFSLGNFNQMFPMPPPGVFPPSQSNPSFIPPPEPLFPGATASSSMPAMLPMSASRSTLGLPPGTFSKSSLPTSFHPFPSSAPPHHSPT